jgi:hypothetical protein
MANQPQPAAAPLDSLERKERRERAIALGRERRKRNRELLQRRERELDPPSSPLVEGLMTLLCGALFVPLLMPIGMITSWVNYRVGEPAAWVVGALLAALFVVAIYHGPRRVRAIAREGRAMLRGARRDPMSFAMSLCFVLGIPLFTLVVALSWRSR